MSKSTPKFEALIAAYPKLFNEGSSIINQRGIECGDGWYDLVETLCHSLQARIDQAVEYSKYPAHAELSASHPQCTLMQIKEKFGRLTIYADGATPVQRAMIGMAESMSSKLCETCGKPGKMQRGGWLYVACDEHIRP